MTVLYAVYNETTGEILRTGSVPFVEDLAVQALDGEGVAENPDNFGFNYMWDGSAFQPRADLDTICTLVGNDTWVADGVTEVTYGPSLPGNCTALVYESSGAIPPITIDVTDGTFELATDFPGTYIVTLKAFPYLNKELVLEASAV